MLAAAVNGGNFAALKLRPCRGTTLFRAGPMQVFYIVAPAGEVDAALRDLAEPILRLSESGFRIGAILNLNRHEKELGIAIPWPDINKPPLAVADTATLGQVEPNFPKVPWTTNKTAVIRIAPRDAKDMVPLQKCHAELKRIEPLLLAEFIQGNLIIALSVAGEIEII
ncbi:MAG: hypothetical protein MUD10_04970 [Candidatus Pacebacteria bacterium]|jgi:hypothetical protein|nr:hypothetical protein [Candidatus Paceibacterota bacterium]